MAQNVAVTNTVVRASPDVQEGPQISLLRSLNIRIGVADRRDSSSSQSDMRCDVLFLFSLQTYLLIMYICFTNNIFLQETHVTSNLC